MIGNHVKTYAELLAYLHQFSPEQLEKPILIDDEQSIQIMFSFRFSPDSYNQPVMNRIQI